MPYSFECAARHLVHGDHDFGEIVLHLQQVAELTVMNLLISNHISYLHIEPFPLFFTREIDLFFTDPANGYFIPRSLKMKEAKVFQYPSDIGLPVFWWTSSARSMRPAMAIFRSELTVCTCSISDTG